MTMPTTLSGQVEEEGVTPQGSGVAAPDVAAALAPSGLSPYGSQAEPPAANAFDTLVAGHNDFWNRYESGFGQSFVATPRFNSAAYDSQYARQIAWMAKSPFDPRVAPDRHRAHVEEMERYARLFAAAPNMLAALQKLEPYLDAIVCFASTMDEHEPNRIAKDARDAIALARGEQSNG